MAWNNHVYLLTSLWVWKLGRTQLSVHVLDILSQRWQLGLEEPLLRWLVYISDATVSLASVSFLTWRFFFQDHSSMWCGLLPECWSQESSLLLQGNWLPEGRKQKLPGYFRATPKTGTVPSSVFHPSKQPQALPRLRKKKSKCHLWWWGECQGHTEEEDVYVGDTVGTILGK